MKLNPNATRHLKLIGAITAFCATVIPTSQANERLFTYTYEPETMPQGAFEVEQWGTWRAGRNSTVGQKNYHRFQFRTELE